MEWILRSFSCYFYLSPALLRTVRDAKTLLSNAADRRVKKENNRISHRHDTYPKSSKTSVVYLETSSSPSLSIKQPKSDYYCY